MSSLFDRRQDRYFIATMTSHVIVAASMIMIISVLTEGWLW